MVESSTHATTESQLDATLPRGDTALRFFRRALRAALSWKPQRLVIAHGVLPEENGRDALQHGLRWLGGAHV